MKPCILTLHSYLAHSLNSDNLPSIYKILSGEGVALNQGCGGEGRRVSLTFGSLSSVASVQI